jgi:quercetin dioxygenase-like cupin family protein
VTATTQRSPLIRDLNVHPWMETWGGVRMRVLVSGIETGGAYTILEYVAPPTGLGPPLHFHRTMDESFHVVEGELNFQVNDQKVVAPMGTFLHVPAGVPHAFWNSSNKPAKFIGTISPGGFENYLIELFELASKHSTVTNDLRPLIAQIGNKYDQVIVGPPPGVKIREELQR